ncbi:N-(5'-phosphoribosyl)anthranilate isomerase [Sulfitobacter noctilucicola]|uniref:N-(5'-phosphoribosyl)anthranilate isomerase n=1 Tax=Sulfitobacter noctilucicola TaxID=1342301 RepID=A0A7W6M723_9RHOB|nr:phosphoribosylanthranilate isomerase [Sulfitobacter noctilucicola]KIN61885.1 N-(5'-phosphoribosyl)anthranilate isomerase [Sulfitobacter noctilucicola]MBB4173594.1 phosphoribosylanthranilate isomerase [Sulfitobacter noctilucicola]
MPSHINVKICGVTRPVDVAAVADAGARYMGLVFFPKSPRFVTLEKAAELSAVAPVGLCKVALVVNPTDAELDAITESVPLDMLQLHGSETPERVSEIKVRYGLPVMKAIGVGSADDLAALDIYGQVADQLLVDTKPPKDAVLPGGNGLAFDWSLVAGRRWPVPWMLAGGLNADTVREAIRVTGATQVDLSSAVESSPGVKDAGLIHAFCKAALAD